MMQFVVDSIDCASLQRMVMGHTIQERGINASCDVRAQANIISFE